MRQILIIALITLLASCSVVESHKYIVISNNYKDTSVVWADFIDASYKHNNVRLKSSQGDCIFYNVNKIIAQYED